MTKLTLLFIFILTIASSCTENTSEKKSSSIQSKVSMNTTYTDLLKQISINAIKLGDFEYSETELKQQWLGTIPASNSEIESAEQRLGIVLPKEYKDFLTTTNGFKATSNIYPTFHEIEKIDYLYKLDKFQVDIWLQEGTEDIGNKLKRSILIAGIGEEQYFLLIPPLTNEPWKYWSFASWYPGEVTHDTFKAFWLEVNDFLLNN